MKQIPEFIKLNKYSLISFGLKEFLKGEISEEKYIDTRKDVIDRIKFPWPELFFLKTDMELYREYLLKFSLRGRRTILLEEEAIGIHKSNFYKFYGISSNTIRKYVGKIQTKEKEKRPPLIRDMKVKHPNEQKEVIAFFALISRVPISWLMDEKPELEWSIDYFNYLPHTKVIGISEFLEEIMLEKEAIRIKHDVYGCIINEGVKFPLYLRVESIYDGFIIEVLNPNFGLNDIFVLRNILKNFDYVEEGYMETVIESHKNYAFIINKKNMKPICIPMEFKRHSFSTTL